MECCVACSFPVAPRPPIIEGPFPESKQLVAGYWILQVPSMEEAVEWAERFSFEAWSRIYPGEYGAEVEIEIRQVFEPES
jgi:hypothetical protein